MAINITAANLQTLSRGPTILTLSIITFILPYLLALSFQTLLLIASSLIGIIITVSDIHALLRAQYDHLIITFRRYGDELILDDLLRGFLGYDGFMTASIGSLFGTFALYVLPLSKELRWRIIRQVWGDDDQHDYLQRILFRPGGVWILKDTLFEEKTEEEIAFIPPIKVESGGSDMDMEWDDDAETKSNIEAGSQIDLQENSSIDSTCMASTSTASLVVAAAATEVAKVEQGILKSPHRTSISTSNDDSIVQICFDVVQHISKLMPINPSVDDKQIQRAGAAAAFMFLVQMKYSRSARRIVWNIAQSSTACSLVFVAIGTLGTVHWKNKCLRWGYGYNGAHSNIQHSGTCIESTGIGTPSSGDGDIMAMKRFINWLSLRFKSDKRFKEKWQGLAALVILYYIRHAKERSKVKVSFWR